MITPGPVVITVVFIGFLAAGFLGAVAAAIRPAWEVADPYDLAIEVDAQAKPGKGGGGRLDRCVDVFLAGGGELAHDL